MILNNKQSIHFLLFAAVIVILGALLEYLRQNETAEQERRVFLQSELLPDEIWDGLISAKEHLIAPYAAPLPGDIKGYLKENDHKDLRISIPKTQCRLYIAVIKPPARLDIVVEPSDADVGFLEERDYLKAGRICAPESAQQESIIHITATALDAGGQYTMAPLNEMTNNKLAELKPDAASVSKPSEPPTPPKKPVTHIVCTGEFEGGCSSPHDIWVPCPNLPDAQLGVQVCGNEPVDFRRTFGRGGNRCGYSTIAVTCSPPS
jgi:hypothetical protein